MRHGGIRHLWVLLLGLLAGGGGSFAQSLSSHLTDQCVRATVKISSAEAGRSTFGSGSVIDARGYVLTNFHVVGNVTPANGTPGTLLSARNRYEIASVESSREAARPRWLGMVVRGDTRLDLALVRIVSDADGNGVGGARFPTVSIAGTRELRPGSRVWAFGYPLGVRTINVTGGNVTGFEMNTRDEVAWLRSDAEFNPGNSGGMLVEAHGRLVAVPTAVLRDGTLEPIELARPTERIPREWLADLRRGHIDDVRLTGVPRLEAGLGLYDSASGDGRGLGNREELLYLLPDQRPGILRLSKALPVAVANRLGLILRRGEGEVEVDEGDPEGMMAAVMLERTEDPVRFELRYEVVPRREPEPPPEPDVEPPPPSPAPPPADEEPEPAPPAAPVATIRWVIVDAATGRPVTALVLIGQPGLDIRAHIEALLAGRIADPEFSSRLAAAVRADVNGRCEITDVPRGQRYESAVMSAGYRTAFLTVAVADQASPIYLDPILLVRQ